MSGNAAVVENPCKQWTKNIDAYGYGRISAKTDDGRYIMVKAHRVAYCEAHGLDLDDIDGWVVRHKCDNRACVEPEHLELGTNLDNIRDRHERGRNATGLSHGMAKLCDEAVRDIRSRFVKGSRGPDGAVALAGEYGVSRSAILMLANGTRRQSVKDNE